MKTPFAASIVTNSSQQSSKVWLICKRTRSRRSAEDKWQASMLYKSTDIHAGKEAILPCRGLRSVEESLEVPLNCLWATSETVKLLSVWAWTRTPYVEGNNHQLSHWVSTGRLDQCTARDALCLSLNASSITSHFSAMTLPLTVKAATTTQK